MKKAIYLLVVSILSISCVEKQTTELKSEIGEVQINLNKESTPEEVVRIVVELLNDEFENRVAEFIPQNSDNGEITFNEIEVGNWEIEISAYNSDEELIYFGSSNISVTAGKVTVATIQLSRVNDGSTGTVFIYVTWDNDIFKNWFDYPANPILEKENNNLDYKGIAQSYVLQVNDGYMMWYTGLSGNSSHIYAAISDDGLTWVPYSTEPVLSPDTTKIWESRNVSTGAVIMKDDLFYMYYTARSTSESEYSPWYIGLAISEDGFQWTKNQHPVFSGVFGGWDLKIAASSIQIIDGVYYMYYTGKTYLSDHQIGLANSVDGVIWERYGSGPIFSNSQSWEGQGYYYPTVVKNNEKYLMIYNNSVSNISGFGYAESNNGIEWSKLDSNPFITSDETYNKWERILYPNIIETEDEYRIYYTGYNVSQDERAICVLRSFK